MRVGTTSQAYGEASYWDRRYSQDEGPFDWYQKYPALAPLFHLYMHRHHRILMVGCGNSELGEDMINDGYQDVVNIDISSVVIEAMQKKYRDRPELKYIKMDVRDMSSFESGSFDTVIDKGTLDSLMCGHNAQQNARMMLEEVGRVLKSTGVYILITYGALNFRLPLLRETCLWTIKLHDRLASHLTSFKHVRRSANNDVNRLARMLWLGIAGDIRLPPPSKKLGFERGSEHKLRELTDPIPLNKDGSSAIAVLGENPEVHYIYVCIKDEESSRQQH
ncbi:S-adenosyl-L-methionine-dependent methyltransferases superfamily protein isoform X1 [Tasmannia lanceolata]|uniref:S-adenosyl-L-methionine-dependent methyltransferases superfamily protein isoform X1 n=1 Tax=Tasmannia lanceolata TaxID=3420 RepID=UPI00406424AA